MARRETKTAALTVATGVMTFGIQQLTAGETVTGAVGLIVGLLLFTGYQFAEEADHGKVYDEVVGAIGTDTFERLSELSADELRSAIEDRREG